MPARSRKVRKRSLLPESPTQTHLPSTTDLGVHIGGTNTQLHRFWGLRPATQEGCDSSGQSDRRRQGLGGSDQVCVFPREGALTCDRQEVSEDLEPSPLGQGWMEERFPHARPSPWQLLVRNIRSTRPPSAESCTRILPAVLARPSPYVLPTAGGRKLQCRERAGEALVGQRGGRLNTLLFDPWQVA